MAKVKRTERDDASSLEKTYRQWFEERPITPTGQSTERDALRGTRLVIRNFTTYGAYEDPITTD